MAFKKGDKGTLKYPIKNGLKECGICHEMLLVNLFSKQSPSKIHKKKGLTFNLGLRTNCKKCRSDYSTRKQLEKSIERYPNMYVDCSNEECNWIFSKRRSFCPKCDCEPDNILACS